METMLVILLAAILLLLASHQYRLRRIEKRLDK
jgi:hypothetical protein